MRHALATAVHAAPAVSALLVVADTGGDPRSACCRRFRFRQFDSAPRVSYLLVQDAATMIDGFSLGGGERG